MEFLGYVVCYLFIIVGIIKTWNGLWRAVDPGEIIEVYIDEDTEGYINRPGGHRD